MRLEDEALHGPFGPGEAFELPAGTDVSEWVSRDLAGPLHGKWVWPAHWLEERVLQELADVTEQLTARKVTRVKGRPVTYPAAKWDERFLQLAGSISSWSKDPSTKVGAVIVDPDNRVVSSGYNGLPRGVEDRLDRLNERDVKLRLTLHAEHNAILFACRDLTGCTIYITAPPCAHCAAQIIQTGITRVVYRQPEPEFAARWGEHTALAQEVLAELDVEVAAAGPQVDSDQ